MKSKDRRKHPGVGNEQGHPVVGRPGIVESRTNPKNVKRSPSGSLAEGAQVGVGVACLESPDRVP